ncbi:hypothetical protein [Dictyobacter formicarum]|uniref:DUF4115 domain-containing protein n=1 Tax=Dictyobacter formicarum TaxID=2778368 RepID=A0ABQ3VAF4_9CHLR|nr:hypothetical protein [Dictyobacter formicarum]GHO83127.1 hypothetical protein KSZ_11330 [Dictyobacter formicarum]
MDRDDENQTIENVNERDEKLTIENVDEQVEHYLSLLPAPVNAMPLLSAISDLQSIYTEDRRLEQAWKRINNYVSVLNAGNNVSTEELSTIQLAREEKKIIPVAGLFSRSGPYRTGKRSLRPSRWNWRIVATGLVAAILLLTIFAWPFVSYALHGTLLAGLPSSTPQSQSTVNVSSMKEYSGQYFKIQYPSDWVVTQVATGDGYLQTVHLRPSTTSAVFVNINVLTNSTISADQLLRMDSDVKLGTRLKTSAITYHGIPWKVGIVERTGSTNTQAGKLKVAYSNQGTPYRIEFGATADKFGAYTSVFDAMFASFYAQTTPVVRSTATTTSTTTVTTTGTPEAVATPSAPAAPSPTTGTLGLKVYSGQYFKIQYPSNWVVTKVTTGGGYQQTVQLRPSTTSAVSVNIDVLLDSPLPADQLLQMDSDIKLGTLLSTNSATYHGVSWNIGIANILDPVLNQPRKVEVAYSNQNTPYKIEFSAPPDIFNANIQSFNTILTSFNPTN